MALRYDPRLYTGGAVEVDSSPSVNMYGQLLAKKQAKEEAIDEYYRKLPSTLNSAGMRDQSIPFFNKALGEAQKYYMTNSAAIRKGTTPEAYNYEKMIRDISGNINIDKNAAKTDLELGKMRFSKENGYIFEDPTFMKAQKLHSLSPWEEGFSPIDLGTISLPPKPFDDKDREDYYKSLTSGMEVGKHYDYSKSYTHPQTRQVIVPTIDIFKDDQIKKAAEKAMDIVVGDKSKMLYFEKLLNSPNKKDWEILQDAYSKYFPKGGAVDSAEKAAAADAIIKLSIPKKYAEEQELQRNAPTTKVYVSSGGSKTGEVTINDVYGSIDEKTNDPRRPHKSVPFNELNEDEGSVIMKIAKERLGNDITQADIYVQKDSDGIIRIKSVDGSIVAPLSKKGINTRVQPSVKEKREVINQGNTKPKTVQPTKNNPLGLDL